MTALMLYKKRSSNATHTAIYRTKPGSYVEVKEYDEYLKWEKNVAVYLKDIHDKINHGNSSIIMRSKISGNFIHEVKIAVHFEVYQTESQYYQSIAKREKFWDAGEISMAAILTIRYLIASAHIKYENLPFWTKVQIKVAKKAVKIIDWMLIKIKYDSGGIHKTETDFIDLRIEGNWYDIGRDYNSSISRRGA